VSSDSTDTLSLLSRDRIMSALWLSTGYPCQLCVWWQDLVTSDWRQDYVGSVTGLCFAFFDWWQDHDSSGLRAEQCRVLWLLTGPCSALWMFQDHNSSVMEAVLHGSQYYVSSVTDDSVMTNTVVCPWSRDQSSSVALVIPIPIGGKTISDRWPGAGSWPCQLCYWE